MPPDESTLTPEQHEIITVITDGLWKQMSESRKQQRVALSMLFVLIVMVGSFTVITYNTAKKAQTNEQVIYASCLGTNVERANNTILWTAAIKSFVHPNNPPETTAALAEITKLVSVTDSPRKCYQLTH